MPPRDPALSSKIMKRIKGKNTGIEIKLRKALSQKGVRYRLYSSSVIGHPDLLLEQYRIAIFCDSEFWHGYRFEENLEKIKTNTSYWIPKIRRNIERDEEVNRALKEDGYLVLRFWGNEIEKNLEGVVETILEAIETRKRVLDLKKKIQSCTTLCYIEDGDRYLFLHRVKKKQDPNEGKYIGVGGHLEKGESPIACMKREILEETGLVVKKYHYLGKIDFLNDLFPPERMYLYKVTSFEGELRPCDEGDLLWVCKKDMMNLNLWEGDRVFLPLLDQKSAKPFRLDLFYHDNELAEVIGPYYEKSKKAKKTKKRKA